jgi:hypothetical protein
MKRLYILYIGTIFYTWGNNGIKSLERGYLIERSFAYIFIGSVFINKEKNNIIDRNPIYILG